MSCTFCTVHGADLTYISLLVLFCIIVYVTNTNLEDLKTGNIVGHTWNITPEISVVKYFSPVSFHFITHNFISEIVCLVLFACMDYFGGYWHWSIVYINSTFETFTGGNDDVFNTYYIFINYKWQKKLNFILWKKNESKCNGISRILKGQIWQMKSSDCLYLLDHNRNAPACVCLICVIIVQDCGCVTCKQCCTHLWSHRLALHLERCLFSVPPSVNSSASTHTTPHTTPHPPKSRLQARTPRSRLV